MIDSEVSISDFDSITIMLQQLPGILEFREAVVFNIFMYGIRIIR
jgi:hypothetical protein